MDYRTRIRHWLGTGVSARRHWPGSIFTLTLHQEFDSPPYRRPILFLANQIQDIQGLAGGIGVAGKVISLSPPAVRVLACQEEIDISLEALLKPYITSH
jgi:hypothetical protein